MSTDPGVYLKKKFLALDNGDALHENASFRGAAFVVGSSGDLASCVAFLREDFAEEISQ